MKIIVTGSNGLVGKSIIKQLINRGDNVISHNRTITDLEDYPSTKEFFDLHKDADTIIHCAAKVGGVQANMDDNEGFFKSNVIINNNICNIAINNNIKNVVNILSTCVFPDNATYPLTPEQIDSGSPHSSNYGYSYAKRLLYYTTKFAKIGTGNNWISIIPTNIYGENDYFNLKNSHLIPALIRKAYTASKSGDNFEVWGDGTPLRQFIYVEDLSKIILWTIDNWKENKPFMAVNPIEYSIKEVVDIIAKRFKIEEKRIVFDTLKPNGQHRKPAITNISNDFKFTSLKNGLNKTIDWFIDNIDKIRK